MKAWVLAAGVSLGLTGVSSAHPLDSPGTIYIDGVACNLPCQSYMAWSRKALKANQPAKGAPNAPAHTAAREIDQKRILKRVEPVRADASSHNTTGKQVAAATTAPEPPLPKPRNETVPQNMEARESPAPPATSPEPSPLPQPKAESTGSPSLPKQKSTRELVMAALAVAEQITGAEPSKATDGHRTDKAGEADPSSSGNAAGRVVILISRPEIKSTAGLTGLNVAINPIESEVQDDIRAALTAAGASGVQLSVSDASPIDRMIGSDVEAAVLKLVSPEAAEAFPDIKGFKVLRVPVAAR